MGSLRFTVTNEIFTRCDVNYSGERYVYDPGCRRREEKCENFFPICRVKYEIKRENFVNCIRGGGEKVDLTLPLGGGSFEILSGKKCGVESGRADIRSDFDS